MIKVALRSACRTSEAAKLVDPLSYNHIELAEGIGRETNEGVGVNSAM